MIASVDSRGGTSYWLTVSFVETTRLEVEDEKESGGQLGTFNFTIPPLAHRVRRP
jgi:hypothetical protein